MFNKKRLVNGEEHRKSFFVVLFKTIIWIILIIGIILYYLNSKYLDLKEKIIIPETKIIKIELGDTFLSLSEKLKINDLFLKYYLIENDPNYELQAGNYKLEKNSNIDEVIESLKEPITNEKDITILEGWNIYDIDEMLALNGYTKKGEYIEYVTNNEKIKKLKEFFPFLDSLKTLEGFLYPDTYKINPLDFKINVFVIKQLETFENKILNKILKPNDLTNKQIIDLIILSSIVEKEEKSITNKPMVAGILKKRLNEGWMIGADITVCYAYKLTSEECKMSISKYLKEKNNYNTRTMVGLPETPIGNPSYETVNATLNHKDSDYYYYLHESNSLKIHYAKTNYEHEQNKSLYLK